MTLLATEDTQQGEEGKEEGSEGEEQRVWRWNTLEERPRDQVEICT